MSGHSRSVSGRISKTTSRTKVIKNQCDAHEHFRSGTSMDVRAAGSAFLLPLEENPARLT